MMQISVITAVRNCAETIAEAIQSVQRQDYPDIQHIVIDAASTDGTDAIISKFASSIDCFVSEPDEGIADAWNKALSMATGEYVMFLNGDDRLPSNFVSSSIERLGRRQDVVLYGDTVFFSGDSQHPHTFEAKFSENKIKLGFGFMHTSCIFPASAFADFRFSLSNSIAVDTEHLLWCFKRGFKFEKGPAVNFMRRGGISDRQWAAATRQYVSLLEKNAMITSTEKRALEFSIPLRVISRKLKLGQILRKMKKQAYFACVAMCNFSYAYSPFFIKRIISKGMRFQIHRDAAVQGGVRFFAPGRLQIGLGSMVNRGVFLDNRMGISIGENVNVAHDCRIYTLGHDVRSPSFRAVGGPVAIDDYAVLFAACMIMPNVKVGRGAVILPGSVVIRDVPAYEIHGGNPAAKVGVRDAELMYAPRRSFWFAP